MGHTQVGKGRMVDSDPRDSEPGPERIPHWEATACEGNGSPAPEGRRAASWQVAVQPLGQHDFWNFAHGAMETRSSQPASHEPLSAEDRVYSTLNDHVSRSLLLGWVGTVSMRVRAYFS
mmetsp:Transcript_7491/g.12987  ORF Transcript_7491/g.12987 Transcript_7491/m.12987 type:complete len:119 (+) Transcript_7491:368-724(+)